MGEPELCDDCRVGEWHCCNGLHSCLSVRAAYRAGLEAAERMARERIRNLRGADGVGRAIDELCHLADAIRAAREGGRLWNLTSRRC